ncbi:MAG: hypothetical protein K0Q51_1338 [Rickettsiaceae bacterium]|jgi:hypothetical protein|nr:hypothetical protein [Rickettsiaceae bacterium]
MFQFPTKEDLGMSSVIPCAVIGFLITECAYVIYNFGNEYDENTLQSPAFDLIGALTGGLVGAYLDSH